MINCEFCGKPYTTDSCDAAHLRYTPRGEVKKFLLDNGVSIESRTQVLPRVRVGAFNDFIPASKYKERGVNACADCGAKLGGYHHAYCDNERCPRCGGQLLSCNCSDSYDIDALIGWYDEGLEGINANVPKTTLFESAKNQTKS